VLPAVRQIASATPGDNLKNYGILFRVVIEFKKQTGEQLKQRSRQVSRKDIRADR